MISAYVIVHTTIYVSYIAVTLYIRLLSFVEGVSFIVRG